MDNLILPLSNVISLLLCAEHTCNHRCIFCYQHKRDFTSKIDPRVYKNLAPVYPYLKDFTMQGGEPTISKDVKNVAFEIMNVNPNVKLSIITNGHKFDKSWQDLFAQHGRWVHFSINAATEETYNIVTPGGNFKETIHNFTAMRELSPDIPMIATMCVVDENAHEISAFVQLAKSLGANTASIFFDDLNSPQDKKLVAAECQKALDIDGIEIRGAEQLYRVVTGTINDIISKLDFSKICPTAFGNIFLSVDGLLRYCCFMNRSPGSLAEHGIEELWNNQESQHIRRCFFTGKYQEIGCNLKKCMFLG